MPIIKSIVSKLGLGRKSQSDCIRVSLYGLEIMMTRITNPDIPHEVTVVIPRAEIREKYDYSRKIKENEIILNSITVVRAPGHPPGQ